MKNLIKLVDKFNGTQDVVMWLDKLKRLCKLQGVKEDLSNIIPLFLEGAAYECYCQMDGKVAGDSASLEKALQSAFGMDPFEAFEKLRNRRYERGESVECYLANIKRLATLCDIKSDSFILHSFVTGLPRETVCQLRAQVRVGCVSEAELVEKTKIFLANSEGVTAMPMRFGRSGTGAEKSVGRSEGSGDAVAMPMRAGRPAGGDLLRCDICKRTGHTRERCWNRTEEIVCHRCKGVGHMARACPSGSAGVKCFRCGELGHFAAKCRVQPSGNGQKGSSAPVDSQRD